MVELLESPAIRIEELIVLEIKRVVELVVSGVKLMVKLAVSEVKRVVELVVSGLKLVVELVVTEVIKLIRELADSAVEIKVLYSDILKLKGILELIVIVYIKLTNIAHYTLSIYKS